MKVTETLTWGGLDGTHKGKNPEQPIQQCMIERPEVSRGHSTGKGDVPGIREYERNGKGRTMGAWEMRKRSIDV